MQGAHITSRDDIHLICIVSSHSCFTESALSTSDVSIAEDKQTRVEIEDSEVNCAPLGCALMELPLSACFPL